MKTKLSKRFWLALTLFSFIGQVAWAVENMYFNVFIYKVFNASASDISLMVGASAVAATLTTVFVGALSDKIGKRKMFICLGYILWGISILSFSLIRVDVINKLFPMAVSASSIGVSLVIIMDCVMTFFGSSANDAAFNAWVTDTTDETNRGSAEGINSMMPLVAILAVFGGFMSFDLDLPSSWTSIFIIIGIVVILIGVLGFFLINEPEFKPIKDGYFSTVFYGFSPKSLKENKSLYKYLLLFIIFNISIQIFMPYLIIYYEVSLGMTDYVFIMAPAIVLASVFTAFWGRVYDKKGFAFSSFVSLVFLTFGYLILYFFRSTLPVFIGSYLMMSGYLSGMAVYGAKIRDNTPEGKSGRLQGVRIFSQVLIPGIIGPFIGKTILSDAKTIIGSDGTESFVPSADIFLGALIPILILIVILIFTSKKDRNKTTSLTTYYEMTDPPLNTHPRPSFKRDNFTSLNGEWSFRVLRKGKIDYDGSITVPYPPESELSGVKRITKKHDVLVYERSFDVVCSDKKLILHFGACDNECEIYVNGKYIGENKGGYLPFEFDISDYVNSGNNTITVTVTDSLDKSYPYGKQKYKRGGMWYTPISGIWQTVWLEYVPQSYIKDIKVNTTLNSVTFNVQGGCGKKILKVDGKEYAFDGSAFTINIDNGRLWTPDEPNLYEFSLTSGEDTVYSYFALRTVTINEIKGKKYICLNGKPYFFHGLLDQGYFPDGIYTPKSEEAYKDDILKMKKLGFNMLRKHIKIEPDVFYYYCDKYGMAVFQDMVNNGTYSFVYDTVLPTIGLKNLPKRQNKRVKSIFYESAEKTIELLYNHPCVVYYTIFNEGWGQHNSFKAYDTLKPLDTSRVWDTASGWFGSNNSDVQSEHVYFKKADFKMDDSKPVVLSEFGGYSCNIEGHSFNLSKVYGYKICKTKEDLTQDLEKLYMTEIIPLVENGLNATVLTQITDVEDETNGILTYDRKVIKTDEEVMMKISNELLSVFQKVTE